MKLNSNVKKNKLCKINFKFENGSEFKIKLFGTKPNLKRMEN